MLGDTGMNWLTHVKDEMTDYLLKLTRRGDGSRGSGRWPNASTAPRNPCLPTLTEIQRRLAPPTSPPPAHLPLRTMKVSGWAASSYIVKGDTILSSSMAVMKLMLLLTPQKGGGSRERSRPARRQMFQLIVSQPLMEVPHPPMGQEKCREREESTRSTAAMSTGRSTKKPSSSRITLSRRQSMSSQWRHLRQRTWGCRRTSRRPSPTQVKMSLARRLPSSAQGSAKSTRRPLMSKTHLDGPRRGRDRHWGTGIVSRTRAACCGAERAGTTRSSGRTASALRALEQPKGCMLRGSGDFRKGGTLSTENL